MKKYIGLLSVTAMVILAFTLWGNAMKSSVAAVKTIEVIPITAQETVTCSGKTDQITFTGVELTGIEVVAPPEKTDDAVIEGLKSGKVSAYVTDFGIRLRQGDRNS